METIRTINYAARTPIWNGLGQDISHCTNVTEALELSGSVPSWRQSFRPGGTKNESVECRPTAIAASGLSPSSLRPQANNRSGHSTPRLICILSLREHLRGLPFQKDILTMNGSVLLRRRSHKTEKGGFLWAAE